VSDPLAAAIALFALGANLLGATLLLLFNPESRVVRWYTGFQVGLMAWLLSQGMGHLTGDWSVWDPLMAVSVASLPGLFVAASLAQDPRRPPWHAWAALGLTVLAVPLGARPLLPDPPTWANAGGLLWHVGGWTAGSVLQARRTGERLARIGARDRRAVVTTLLLLAPASVAAGFVLGADGFFTYLVPLMTVVVQILVFYGVTRMRFYDIEVRVARTGELVTRATELERLALLGELSATVAHEVRNPLTGVRSLAQRLAEDAVNGERRKRYAEVILQETSRVERLVRDLLDVARDTARPQWSGEPTRLEPLFQDLRLLTQARAEEAGSSVRFEARVPSVQAPRDPLAQVLLNLLLNALDHSPDGGTVRVLVDAPDGRVEIAVRDEGPGVPPAERERIFEPFRGGRHGTGLGLSVVRRLGRELGWDVLVGEAPGGGAEFRLVMPDRPA
jgi:signal transduction histidine kinase